MSSNDSKQYSDARSAQNFFREAIESCMKGDLDGFEKTVESYLNANPRITSQDVFQSFKSEGKTLAHIAASGGRSSIMDYILGECSHPESLVNAADENGFTTLINATIAESDSIMEKLISLGANVNDQNKDGAAAVHFAAGDGSVPRLDLLLKAGANLHLLSQSGSTLHWAAGKGRGDVIKFLIERGVEVNRLNESGLPPVVMAAVSGCDLGVKYLVDGGADVGHILSGNLTLLHLCSEYGLHNALQSILELESGKACLSIRTDDGNLPIHLAAMSGNRSIVEMLLPFSVDLVDAADLDSIMVDGAKRMKAWEDRHTARTQEAVKADPVVQVIESTRELESRNSAVDRQAEEASEQYKEQGNALFISKKYEEAIEAYSSAIRMNGSNKLLWSNRSACYLLIKQPVEALRDAEVCRQLDPNWAKGCYRLASARLELGMFEDAAVAAFEGCKLEETNASLKALLQKAVKLGQDDHKRKQQQTQTESSSR